MDARTARRANRSGRGEAESTSRDDESRASASAEPRDTAEQTFAGQRQEFDQFMEYRREVLARERAAMTAERDAMQQARAELEHLRDDPASRQTGGSTNSRLLETLVQNQASMMQEFMEKMTPGQNQSAKRKLTAKLDRPVDFWDGSGDKTAYKRWRNNVNMWAAKYPDEDKATLVPFLVESISGSAREMLDCHFSLADMMNADGFDEILKQLDSEYGEEKFIEDYFHVVRFRNVRRNGRTFDEYITEFKGSLARVKFAGFTQDDRISSMDLIMNAELSEIQMTGIMQQAATRRRMQRQAPGDATWDIPFEEMVELVSTTGRSAYVRELEKSVRPKAALTASTGPPGRGAKRPWNKGPGQANQGQAPPRFPVPQVPGKGKGKGDGKGKGKGGGKGGHGKGGEKPTCFECGKVGHMKAQCWKAHPELRPNPDNRPGAKFGKHKAQRTGLVGHEDKSGGADVKPPMDPSV